MRQREHQKYAAILSGLRFGIRTEEELQILNSRVLKKTSDWRKLQAEIDALRLSS